MHVTQERVCSRILQQSPASLTTLVVLKVGEVQPPVPACGVAVFCNVDQPRGQPSRNVKQYGIIIALHARGNAAAAKTQKTNHHAAAAIMAKACTVAGVAEVTDGNPDLALRRCQGQGSGAALAAAFGARPRGHQSLIVAEAGRADGFVCKIAREGQEGFRGKDGPAQEDEAARPGERPQKEGGWRLRGAERDLRKELVGSKIVNELYAAYVASIGGEGNLPWDELLPSGNERGGGAAQAEEEQTAAEEHGS